MIAPNTLKTPTKTKHTKEQMNRKFEDLYNQSAKKKEKLQRLKDQRERLKQEKELKQCTFQPKINQQNFLKGSKPSSFIKRGCDWLNAKQKRIQELKKFYDTNARLEYSFQPEVSGKSIQLLQISTKQKHIDKAEQILQIKNQKRSYRQIYKRKEMQKNRQSLRLMTQKRAEQRKNIGRQMESVQKENYQELDSYLPQMRSSQTPLITSVKAEEQDTFSSISSINVKNCMRQTDGHERSKVLILKDQYADGTQQIRQVENKKDNVLRHEQSLPEHYLNEMSLQSQDNHEESSQVDQILDNLKVQVHQNEDEDQCI